MFYQKKKIKLFLVSLNTFILHSQPPNLLKYLVYSFQWPCASVAWWAITNCGGWGEYYFHPTHFVIIKLIHTIKIFYNYNSLFSYLEDSSTSMADSFCCIPGECFFLPLCWPRGRIKTIGPWFSWHPSRSQESCLSIFLLHIIILPII